MTELIETSGDETIEVPAQITITLPETEAAQQNPHSDPMVVEFYFDFLCPYSYRAMLWLTEVRSLLDDDPDDDYLPVQIAYYYFSSEQYARHNGETTKYPGDIWAADASYALHYGADGYIWRPDRDDNAAEQLTHGEPPAYKGLLAFIAGEAARRQGISEKDPLGNRALEKFYTALGKLRHEEGLLIWDRDVIDLAVQNAGLDLERFKRDLDDPEVRESAVRRIEHDHTRAHHYYGMTETPLLVFGGNEPRPAHLKLMPNPTGGRAIALFTHVYDTIANEPAFLGLTVPQTPADKARIELMTEQSQRGLS